MDQPTLSIVIPVFNSEATIATLLERLTGALDAVGESYEIILVDDGSADRSWEALKAQRARYDRRIVLVQLMRNFGQHNAVMCGFRHAKGEFVVTMDDDLQNPPEEVRVLLDHIRGSGADVVYGAYATYREKKSGAFRHAGSAMIRFFYRFAFKINVETTSFRIIRNKTLQSILAYDLNYTYIDGLLAWSTRRIEQVRVQHSPRTQGRSGYSIGKLLVLAVNLFTNFSLLPLQMASALGVLAALGGLTVAVYYLVQYFLANIIIPGYASIVVAVLVLGGLQLLALGVVGEYLGRVHLNINRKPQYVEREVVT